MNVFHKIESNLLVNSLIDKNGRNYSNKSFSDLVVPFIDDFHTNQISILCYGKINLYLSTEVMDITITIGLHI